MRLVNHTGSADVCAVSLPLYVNQISQAATHGVVAVNVVDHA